VRRFEWDERKSEINRKKHGVDFETGQLVFDDPLFISFISNIVDGQERWSAIGTVEGTIVLVVVHTYKEEPPDEVIRIISARRATSHERKLYEQAIG
jgi:uncharacterized protein